MASSPRSRRQRNPPVPEAQNERSQTPFFSKADAAAPSVQAKREAFFQPKLTIGQPDDQYEREADRVADAVTSKPQGKNAPAVQKQEISAVQRLATPDERIPATNDARMAEEKHDKERGPVQRSAAGGMKKEEEKPAIHRSEAKKEEEKPAIHKSEAKKEEEKPVIHKSEAKKEEEKPAIHKSEAKKEEEKPAIHKSEAKKEEEKPAIHKSEAKKEEEKPAIHKSEAKKEEEKPAIHKSEAKKEEEKPAIHKKSGPEEEKPLQAKAEGGGNVASNAAAAKINSSKGQGERLPGKAKRQMESAFGRDFSGVTIHQDAQSENLNKELNAQAFTHGQDIYFDAGKFNPESAEGSKLLAHELTHVVQQNNLPADSRLQRQQGAAKTAAAPRVELHGRTDARFSNHFETRNVVFEPAEGCAHCSRRNPCLRITGELVSTFQATTTVTLPRAASFRGLSECQLQIVQDSIDNVLSPHEQQHVNAFQDYTGTVVTPFEWTICRSAFNGMVRGLHGDLEKSRRADAKAASAALDPFVFYPDLTC